VDSSDKPGSYPDAMTIRQLANRTGVPPRRIRYYISERLLAPPIGRGRAAYYTGQHLERVQQIAALRAVNLSLDEIRARLGEASSSPITTAEPVSDAQTWQRWELIPGVELHVREDLEPDTLSTVRTLVGAVRHVLTENDWSAAEGAGIRE
jgi:DNA-binding transcriptional MerR regulator